jgi:hypothetical protein
MNQQIDWANRWIGGFCAPASVGGLPVRGADYAAHPPLEDALTLPPVLPSEPADYAEVIAAWAEALGGAPVALVRSVERARALLLAAAAPSPETIVTLPANATRPLVEGVKRHGAKLMFRDLDATLGMMLLPAQTAGKRLAWGQPIGGVGGIDTTPWVDYSDTLPNIGVGATWPAVALFGLHLAQDAAQAGALLVFGDADLAQAVAERLGPEDQPDAARALAQLRRLAGDADARGMAERQRTALAETRRGLHEAAGLDLLPSNDQHALAHHVAVRIPDEIDVSTFYAYVRAEQTPARWLPEVRPVHYAALRAPGRVAVTTSHLARWLLVPVGPEYTTEEISHAVLGIVKAAEYLGVRWRQNPDQATEYAAMMDELYGPDHDAYRPLFATKELIQAE